ncbi:protein TIPIN homolog [Prorops nasuta]|uniref:protein TIPIN homolog n=1 Tax=Prorops nasuta TaxID=863751 RepID=UPI0034CEEECF
MSNSITHSDSDNNDDIIDNYENEKSGDENEDENVDWIKSEEDDEEARKKSPDPTTKKHIVRNPIPKLNTERLKGPKGVHTIEKYFEDFKFHGKGYERHDLNRIMKRLEHWSHRLFPKLQFDDFLAKVETLGHKKDMQTFIKKYRNDMITADDDVITEQAVDAEDEIDIQMDEFDQLIAEQLEKQQLAKNKV